jgi:hypothetical protein
MIIARGIMVSNFVKGMYNLMIYVSIDIARFNHFVSALSSDGKELKKLFKFMNAGDGIQMLFALLPVTTTCVLNPIKDI